MSSIKNANFKTGYDNKVYKLSDLNGKLLSYGKSSDSNSFYIPVTFEFENPGDIVPGSFVEVYLLSGDASNVISLPVSSITEEQGINYIYIQVADEVFAKREVTLGKNNGERVEILCGLNAGEKVVTKWAMQVKLASASGEIPHGHSH